MLTPRKHVLPIVSGMSTRRRHGTQQPMGLRYRFCPSKLIRRNSKRTLPAALPRQGDLEGSCAHAHKRSYTPRGVCDRIVARPVPWRGHPALASRGHPCLALSWRGHLALESRARCPTHTIRRMVRTSSLASSPFLEIRPPVPVHSNDSVVADATIRGRCPRTPDILRFGPAAWNGKVTRNEPATRTHPAAVWKSCVFLAGLFSIMPLAQCVKCRRSGGSAPGSWIAPTRRSSRQLEDV